MKKGIVASVLVIALSYIQSASASETYIDIINSTAIPVSNQTYHYVFDAAAYLPQNFQLLGTPDFRFTFTSSDQNLSTSGPVPSGSEVGPYYLITSYSDRNRIYERRNVHIETTTLSNAATVTVTVNGHDYSGSNVLRSSSTSAAEDVPLPTTLDYGVQQLTESDFYYSRNYLRSLTKTDIYDSSVWVFGSFFDEALLEDFSKTRMLDIAFSVTGNVTLDYAELSLYYDAPAPTQPSDIPEPGTLMLCIPALLAIGNSRRRRLGFSNFRS